MISKQICKACICYDIINKIRKGCAAVKMINAEEKGVGTEVVSAQSRPH